MAILNVGPGFPFATIQAAINAAGPGDTIVVAPGTYTENLTITAARTGLTIQGAQVGVAFDDPARGTETIIRGTVSTRANNTTLDGLNIQNNRATTNGASDELVDAENTSGLTVANSILLAGTNSINEAQFGIYSTGSLTVTGTSVTRDLTGAGAGTVSRAAIRVLAGDNVTITDSQVTNGQIFVQPGFGTTVTTGMNITGNTVSPHPNSPISVIVAPGAGTTTLPATYDPVSTKLIVSGNIYPTGAGQQITGTAGADDMSNLGSAGNDRIDAAAGNDTVQGGAGADSLNGGAGTQDVVTYRDSGAGVNVSLATGVTGIGGDAQGDTLVGFENLTGSGFSDTLFGNGDANVLRGEAGDDRLDGAGGSDQLFGGTGRDSLVGGAGSDSLDGGTDDDSLFGGTGTDSLRGGSGDDSLDGGADADRLFGDDGNDTLIGVAGADTLDGGFGNDSLFGGADVDSILGDLGNDSIFGGADDDFLFGGTGNDYFGYALGDVRVDNPGFESVFGGGEDGDPITIDNDILDLRAYGLRYGWAAVVITRTTAEDGLVRLYDRAPNLTGAVFFGTIAFEDIERVICFTPGIRILTDRGDVAVENLVTGDLVVTRDHGLQPIRWIGRRLLSAQALHANPALRPVRIAKGALGADGPDRVMLVSPQHRLLIESSMAELHFGEAEVLVPARHLVGLCDIAEVLPPDGVTYIHILFDAHEIVRSDGIWTESFQPTLATLNALEEAARDEVLTIFPELGLGVATFPGARPSLKRHEARLLADSFSDRLQG
jgi:Ca2+-binding RTX toxin-like protein